MEDRIGAVRVSLASASPRRAELLRAAGIDFEVQAADVDESLREGEGAEAYALRVARAKAAAVPRPGDCAVLAADTVVVVDQVVLGKPKDAGDARRMLEMLSGRVHEVLTAVVLVSGGTSPDAGPLDVQTGVERSSVTFADLHADEIDWYVASGEPMDKAGGYAVQGLASRFVTRIEGSYSNVVGLPVALVYSMLRRLR